MLLTPGIPNAPQTGPNPNRPEPTRPTRPFPTPSDPFAQLETKVCLLQRPAEIRLAAKWRWLELQPLLQFKFWPGHKKKGRSIHFRQLLSHTHVYAAGAADPLQPYIIAIYLRIPHAICIPLSGGQQLECRNCGFLCVFH